METAGDTITVKFNGTDAVKKNARFYGVNALSDLDTAGEYYISPNGTLFFYPPAPVGSWTSDPVVSTHPVVLNVSGAHDVAFTGMSIEYGRETGVLALNVNNVTLSSCSIHGIGQDGVYMTGTNSGVVSSNVYDTGCAGMRVRDFTNTKQKKRKKEEKEEEEEEEEKKKKKKKREDKEMMVKTCTNCQAYFPFFFLARRSLAVTCTRSLLGKKNHTQRERR